MIDTILDFSIDHSEAFIAILLVVVVTVASTVAWGYGKFHERATRRRGSELNN